MRIIERWPAAAAADRRRCYRRVPLLRL